MDPRFFPSLKRLGHKRKGKTRFITCRTDRANEANRRYFCAEPQSFHHVYFDKSQEKKPFMSQTKKIDIDNV